MQQAIERAITSADLNGDGELSKEEAVSAMDLVVGGFFFSSDRDSNGIVTPEEARATREGFFEQHRALAVVFGSVRKGTGESSFASVARLLDIEYGQPLSIAEARRAARAAAEGAFASVDADGNGAITSKEAREAARTGAATMGTAAFDGADGDGDGSLSFDEIRGHVERAARVTFEMADRDKNGKLTRAEAADIVTDLGERMNVRVE